MCSVLLQIQFLFQVLGDTGFNYLLFSITSISILTDYFLLLVLTCFRVKFAVVEVTQTLLMME